MSMTISLSHRSGWAMCAAAPAVYRIGCDVEAVEPRSESFVLDYLTAAEQALVNGCHHADRWRTVALIWSAKESVLKAIRRGLSEDTRTVSVDPVLISGDGWYRLHAHFGPDQVFSGWWRCELGMVWTVVTSPPAGAPEHVAFPRKRLTAAAR
jgi:4'-phosphopantetheinyl transferase